MSSTSDTEREILLGNKQLLTIFFVIAILLGIAFTGGYMVGHGPPEKKTALAATPDAGTASQAAPSPASSVPTLSVTPDSSNSDTAAREQTSTPPAVAHVPSPEEAPLNPRKSSKSAAVPTETNVASAESSPKTGQTFLQVAAVRRTEADALAEVLRQKGFRAHSVQKPGTTDLFRVLVGPVRDTGDLSTTRDALRNTGFTKVIVQHY